MALAATTVWEVRSDGNDDNGGGYTTGGTDYSQQAAAQLSLTDLYFTSGTTLISDTGGFTAAMVGNIIQIKSGTHFTAGFYEIATRVDTNTVTLDRAPASEDTSAHKDGVGKVGGALLRIDKICGTTPVVVAGNIVYVKAGTYSKTTEYTIGCDGSTTGPIIITGYNTTRTPTNTDATRPVITTATNSIAGILMNGATITVVRNLEFENTAGTKRSGIRDGGSANTSIVIERCKCAHATNTLTYGFEFSSGTIGTLRDCEVGHCTTGGLLAKSEMNVYGCYFYDIVGTAIESQSVRFSAMRCIFDTNQDDIKLTATGAANNYVIVNNSFYTSGTYDGIDIAAASGVQYVCIVNNIFYGGAYGINTAELVGDAEQYWIDVNNAFGNQSTAARSFTPTRNIGSVTLTGNPFTNAASGDFSLNNTAGAGAACRAAAFPGVFPGGLSTGYADIGAVQHVDPATTGGGRKLFGALRGT